MGREQVMSWVQSYERAWRDNDAVAVTRLFTEDARYRRSPYWPPLVGHEALAEFWTEDEGAIFTMSAEPVAVEGDVAVVRVRVNYGGDQPQEYTDLWVMHFAADGRVDDFEEWAYWPDKALHGRVLTQFRRSRSQPRLDAVHGRSRGSQARTWRRYSSYSLP